MAKQVHEVLLERTSRLMAERLIIKQEMANRLDMEYLTFWRKLKGKRGIDVVLLMKIATVLGTSAAYLLGETDNPSLSGTKDTSIVIQTNDPSREIVSKPSRLSFHNGEVSIDIPDTPANKKWFDDFIKSMMQMKPSKAETTLETA